ncbi:MAG: hypothetical protein WBO77_01280, partial [Microgenomates group bacterium]
FLILSLLLWIFFGLIAQEFSDDIDKLEDSNDEISTKIDQLSDDTNAMWEERVFEKEMKENLAYHLPDGFNSVVQYTGLIPLDFNIGIARVSFVHRNKSYSVDFSYQTNKEGLRIKKISRVIELTE